MGIYNLEENSNLFITPQFYDNKFVYRMEEIIEEDNKKVIRTIDLREDELLIHGTKIEEPSLQRLYNSLVLRPKVGIFYVNCDGACYILILGKYYRPIYNVTFDWSSFGVIVPNSMNDSMKKQIDEKEHRLSIAEAEVSSTKVGLESTKKDVKELETQFSNFERIRQQLEVELEQVRNQLSSVNLELESTKIQLEFSKKKVKEFKDEATTLKKGLQDMEVELQIVQNRLSLSNDELQSTKTQLEFSKKKVKELKDHFSTLKKEQQGKEMELHKVKDQLSSKLQYTKTELESTERNVKELKDQLLSCTKERQDMVTKQQILCDHLSSLNCEQKCTNQKLDQLQISALWSDLCYCRCKAKPEPPSLVEISEEPQEFDSSDHGLPATRVNFTAQ